MTPSNPGPNRRSASSMPDPADNGSPKQQINEDTREAKREVGAEAREKAEAGQHRLADETDALSDAINVAGRAHDTYDTNTGMGGHSGKNALGDTAAKSQDKAAAVGDRMHGATANMNESMQNARENLVQFYRDQPLIAGSLGIAIGAALGALVPPTEIEDDMLGEARDRSVDAAKSKAARKYGEVRESARTE